MPWVPVPSTVWVSPMTRPKRKTEKKWGMDDIVARLDAVLLAVQGAARLAWTGEGVESPRVMVVEVAAILEIAAEKLNGLSRELSGSKGV